MKGRTIVIGGGQAGLATARCLQRAGIEPVVLDAGTEVGESWRRRYDSLRLFTPAQYDGLPDFAFPAPADTYPSKDAVADYLGEYARRFMIDVQLDHRVDHLRRSRPLAPFELTIGGRTTEAEQVVVATGALQRAWRPGFADELPDGITQIHSADYRNPSSVVGDTVLIVGAGNSGAQIAEELVASGTCHEVAISIGETPKRLPQRVLGRDIFWWLQRTGVLDRTRDSNSSSETTVGAIPLIGSDLPRLTKTGKVRRIPRIVNADSQGLHDASGRAHHPTTVIWATGFRNDFTWIDIDGALDDRGQPQHERGISTTVPGLGFIGLPGLHTKGSGFLGFVGRDAEHLAHHLP